MGRAGLALQAPSASTRLHLILRTYLRFRLVCILFARHSVQMSALPILDTNRRGYSVRGLANWILDYADELGVPITNMALNKLVFFAYEDILLRSGVALTNAKIEAWEHGPVFREIYQSFKDHGDRPITSRASFFSPQTMTVEKSALQLTAADDAIIKAALTPLMSLSPAKLRQLSHVAGGAWHRVWWYRGHANPGMEITPELILASRYPE
jgi:uncharacterized phage-associated protein